MNCTYVATYTCPHPPYPLPSSRSSHRGCPVRDCDLSFALLCISDQIRAVSHHCWTPSALATLNSLPRHRPSGLALSLLCHPPLDLSNSHPAPGILWNLAQSVTATVAKAVDCADPPLSVSPHPTTSCPYHMPYAPLQKPLTCAAIATYPDTI